MLYNRAEDLQDTCKAALLTVMTLAETEASSLDGDEKKIVDDWKLLERTGTKMVMEHSGK